MKILALLKPAAGRTRSDFEPLIIAEEKVVWAAYRSGPLRELYFQADPMIVSLVFEAADTAAVQAIVDSFPMAAAGLLDVEFVTLGAWVLFEALFDKSHLT